MIVFVTSCGRPDLLSETLASFRKNNSLTEIDLIIHEDAKDVDMVLKTFSASKFIGLQTTRSLSLIHTNGIGQHKSIEKFFKNAADEKYYIHIEDDWEFDNNYDWIGASIILMEKHTNIIKTLCRKDSEHPVKHDCSSFFGGHEIKWGYIEEWWNDGICWKGFSWNPGVTRLDKLRKFMPLPKFEQDFAKEIYEAKFDVIELENKIYKHIGYGRSTH